MELLDKASEKNEKIAQLIRARTEEIKVPGKPKFRRVPVDRVNIYKRWRQHKEGQPARNWDMRGRAPVLDLQVGLPRVLELMRRPDIAQCHDFAIFKKYFLAASKEAHVSSGQSENTFRCSEQTIRNYWKLYEEQFGLSRRNSVVYKSTCE
jgi:hypothetical protein